MFCLNDLVLSILVSLDRSMGFDLVEIVVEAVVVGRNLAGVENIVDFRVARILPPSFAMVVDIVVVVVLVDFVAQDTSWACRRDQL